MRVKYISVVIFYVLRTYEHMFYVYIFWVDMKFSHHTIKHIQRKRIHEMELMKYWKSKAPKLINICLIKDHLRNWLISFWVGFTLHLQMYLARSMRIKVLCYVSTLCSIECFYEINNIAFDQSTHEGLWINRKSRRKNI